jgi:glycerol uptake facilitator-like aquaporin
VAVDPTLARRAVAEALGTGFLLVAVVGSGIMAERLAGGNVAIALLANAVATGCALVALILALGPVSAHFNPVVTILQAIRGALRWSEVGPYIFSQVGGAFVGVAAAHVTFGEPLYSVSTHVRSGGPQVISEALATFGLLLVIVGCAREPNRVVSVAVGGYITAAYWFSASTSFANPAVTLARALTDTFAGIRPADVPGFLLGQAVGAGAAALLVGWLYPVRLRQARSLDASPTQERDAG